MQLLDLTGLSYIDPNEISFFLGLVITLLFYRQYRKYEEQVEREEMIEQLLSK
jgi:hypothetical protein